MRHITYYSGIPMWISHHLSLGQYLEYHKIFPWESVQIYEITRVGSHYSQEGQYQQFGC
jgi:hypothetical protein